MIDKDIYIENSYSLCQKEEKKRHIELLNSNTHIVNIANPYIITVKNAIFNKISVESLIDNKLSEERSNELNKEFIEQFNMYKVSNSIKDSKFELRKIFSTITLIIAKEENSDTTIDQEYIYEWLEQLLAKSISIDKRFSKYDILIETLNHTECLRKLYYYLTEYIPIEWINNDIKNWLNIDLGRALGGFYPKDNFEHYFTNFDKIAGEYYDLSPVNFIKKMTVIYQYENLYFSLEYAFKNDLLYKNDLSKWIVFWDKLTVTGLQSITFHNKTPYEILMIVKKIIEKKEILKSNASHLVCILANKFFESMVKTREKLTFYSRVEEDIKTERETFYDKEIVEMGKCLYENWESKKLELYQNFISEIRKLLKNTDIEEWVFSYKYKYAGRNDYTERYNSEIDALTSSFSEILQEITEIGVIFNFQKFNFYADRVKSSDTKIEKETLLNELINFIKNNDFYSDHLFEEPDLKTYRNVAYILSLVENPTKFAHDILNSVKISYEGWNINYLENIRLVEKELFVLNSLIMLFEFPNAFKDSKSKESFFKDLLNYIIYQYRFSLNNNNSDKYILTLRLMLYVANKIYQEQKQHYENGIIDNIDKIEDLMKILGNNEYILSDKLLSKMQLRIIKELPIYKKILEEKGDNNRLNFIRNLEEQFSVKYLTANKS